MRNIVLSAILSLTLATPVFAAPVPVDPEVLVHEADPAPAPVTIEVPAGWTLTGQNFRDRNFGFELRNEVTGGVISVMGGDAKVPPLFLAAVYAKTSVDQGFRVGPLMKSADGSSVSAPLYSVEPLKGESGAMAIRTFSSASALTLIVFGSWPADSHVENALAMMQVFLTARANVP